MMKFTLIAALAIATLTPSSWAATAGIRGDKFTNNHRSLMGGKDDDKSKDDRKPRNNGNDAWFYLTLKHDDYKGKCLTFDPDDDYYVKFDDCKKSSYEEWYYDSSYHTIHSHHDDYHDWCLTLDHPSRGRNKRRAGYLRLEPCDYDGSSFQEWYYSDDDYRFRSGWDQDQCMDYCRDCGGYVHTRKCDSDYDKDQQFYMFYM